MNTTAQWNTVLSQLQLGDVVQAGITGNGHSIIITSVYNSANGVRYCGHTNDVTAELIRSFKSWMETKGFTTITVIRT
ncbi:MAG: amidase domain-containing protein [Oscillospiraceae bacterium]